MENELGNEIKKNRILLGMSQTDLSRITGIDTKTISLIERGIRRKPKPETLLKISEALKLIDVRLLYLAGYSNNEITRTLEDDTYNYKFQIIITGHGRTYAGDLTEAYEYVQEDIDEQLAVMNVSDEHGEVIFNKNYKVIVDFDKDR